MKKIIFLIILILVQYKLISNLPNFDSQSLYCQFRGIEFNKSAILFMGAMV